MNILFYTEGVHYLLRNKKAIRATIERMCKEKGYTVENVNYILCSKPVIKKTNIRYLNHHYYTDIITFDYDEDDIINGDLFISLDTVRTNAEKFGKEYEEELHRVIIHGILHLCGINDKGPGEREIMEAAENKALAMR